jgi:hypothetical protein
VRPHRSAAGRALHCRAPAVRARDEHGGRSFAFGAHVMHSRCRPSSARLGALAVVVSALASCQSAYYNTMEKFGVHKREILVDRVKDGRDAQQDAKEEIIDALEAFKAVAGFEGGELEQVYERLADEYESSADAVEEVRERIDKIENVSAALFEEWSEEIEGMQDPDLKRSSQEMLTDTRARYGDLIEAMETAESKMEPVLVRLNDHVTYLKHNLNARAIASLERSVTTIESDIADLVVDMEKSIAEADAFIASMSE